MVIFIIYQGKMEVTEYHIEADFNLKVMHVSDLHDYDYKKSDIDKALTYEPDIIVITGDIIDRRRFDLKKSLGFIDLLEGYPIYYVTGNHEAWSNQTDQILLALEEKGIHVLRNETLTYKNIKITGFDDPAYMNVPDDLEIGQILLAHRSENIPQYSTFDVDVIFTGHAHGGQFRLFGQGLLSPNQGLLPEYTSGVHQLNGSSAVISRGLGNSIFPLRLFNRPEIIITTIGD